MHLLKLIKQPDKASASWRNTINRERGNIVELLDDNPGLKPRREEAFAKAYEGAVRRRIRNEFALAPISHPTSFYADGGRGQDVVAS